VAKIVFVVIILFFIRGTSAALDHAVASATQGIAIISRVDIFVAIRIVRIRVVKEMTLSKAQLEKLCEPLEVFPAKTGPELQVIL